MSRTIELLASLPLTLVARAKGIDEPIVFALAAIVFPPTSSKLLGGHRTIAG